MPHSDVTPRRRAPVTPQRRSGALGTGALGAGVLWCVAVALVQALPAGVVHQSAPAADTRDSDWLVVEGRAGVPGGELVAALRAEPRTLNPVMAIDNPSRQVIRRLHADLVTIDRRTHQTKLALARRVDRSADGTRMTVHLRRGLRFSDGHPLDADDVVFSFELYLDAGIGSPQRELLLVDGAPIAVRKLDALTVEFTFPKPYAPAERLFDSMAILPRHLLEPLRRQNAIADAWGLQTATDRIAGLGPYRLQSYQPGQRVVLERNPHYWKRDDRGQRLPYLDRLVFVQAADETVESLRLQAGDLDLANRLGVEGAERLERSSSNAIEVRDLGPSLDFAFLLFNLNELGGSVPEETRRRQRWFRLPAFRRAVSLAVDRQAMARLAFRGRAEPMWSHVTPGNHAWINTAIPKPPRSIERARAELAAAGFSWSRDGSLLDMTGAPVAFTMLVSSSNVERARLATLAQEDLRPLGMRVSVVQLEFRAMLERVLRTHDYDTAIMALTSGDVDPNADLNVWRSTGGTHLWRLDAPAPIAPWEPEIDRLLDRQMTTLDRAARKALIDRVQAIVWEQQPIVSLVSPHVLVAARQGLGNLEPGVLDPHLLWNVDELFWRAGRTPDRR